MYDTICSICVFLTDPNKENREYAACQSCSCQRQYSQAEFSCITSVEGYFKQCSASHKAFKKHIIIGVEEYKRLNESSQKYDKVCNLNNQDLISYCNLHMSPVCVRCIQLNHSKCKSLVNIVDIATLLRPTQSDVLDNDILRT